MSTLQNLLYQHEQFEKKGLMVFLLWISSGLPPFSSYYCSQNRKRENVCECVCVSERDRKGCAVGRGGTTVGGGWILPCCGFCFSQRTSENDCNTSSKWTTHDSYFHHPSPSTPLQVSYVYFKCLIALVGELWCYSDLNHFIRQRDFALLRGKHLNLRSCMGPAKRCCLQATSDSSSGFHPLSRGCISSGRFARASPAASTSVAPTAETALEFHHSDAKKYFPASAMI